ncbi:uncharacterized protein YdhG (YjbR/CyaY superfamily) [Bacillus sp. SORGH_AS 510]|uniref:iron chaperone n=1 Tax=Bacillus sp. SORGH_AS_0510 TaxID=3041771 RepID=UPI002785EEBD|nr:DUF1801 domain-containing protein [Bacillus sp. SORGH_AS_0510]MDQ1146116.1 uncharacterized protein YdhG (YjbR/CyaY superfamily) [Bacillus sp. SORGH_AS_0510]
MEEIKKKFNSIDEYISQFPLDLQEKLQALRKVIRESAPDAKEKISYQMPTFVLHKNLVHFAAYRNHIGFYPTSSGIEAFKQDISNYKSSKGAVQFPINQPLPFELISKIVKFRVDEELMKAEKAKVKRNK